MKTLKGAFYSVMTKWESFIKIIYSAQLKLNYLKYKRGINIEM